MSEYKIEAHSEGAQPHTILTSDKARAIRYAAALGQMAGYSRVTVTVGGQVYVGDEIRRMP